MSTAITAEQLIQQFGLATHPEGGYYKETYRAAETISATALPGRFSGDRSFSTAIYFLLDQGNFSAFHRIRSDECWHFYAGGCLLVHIIHFNGELETIRLGNDISQDECFQYVVPAGCWFASEPTADTLFSFVGCTVAPGFDMADFDMADAQELISIYPQHQAIITRLSRANG